MFFRIATLRSATLRDQPRNSGLTCSIDLLQPGTIEALTKAPDRATDDLDSALNLAFVPLDQPVEALLVDVIWPECELGGAPPQAWALGLAAARAGYRLAIAMLGPIAQRDPGYGAIHDVAATVHRMYVYDLLDFWRSAHVEE